MTQGGSINTIVTTTTLGLEPIFDSHNFDLVIVHGDTAATLSWSLVGYFKKIPVAHIEAGLRTFNKYSPFPEEINRQITGVIADFHFTPTDVTRNYLLSENKVHSNIFTVGNTAIDMLKYTIKSDYQHELLDRARNDRLILVTAHRRENINDLEAIFLAFEQIVSDNPDVKIIYPIHMSPIIRTAAHKWLRSENIKIIDPLDVIDFHNIMRHCYLILTDSGGIQEEAPSLSIPVLVIRDTTERPEVVQAGRCY